MNATTEIEVLTGGELAKLRMRAEAAGWRDARVTRGGVGSWGVGCTSGTGIDGVILNVSRFPEGYAGRLERCEACDGRSFPAGTDRDFCEAMDAAREAAAEVAHAHGHTVWFSETGPGQSCMRRAVAKAAGDPRYWAVK